MARRAGGERLALLDNSSDRFELGRWSFLGLCPRREIKAHRTGTGEIEVLAGPINNARPVPGDPLSTLQRFIDESASRRPAGLAPGHPPFTQGAIGYLGYELLHTLEPVPAAPGAARAGDLLHFVEYDVIVAVDQLDGETFICATDDAGGGAIERARELVESAPDRTPLSLAPRGNGLDATGIETAGFTAVTPHADYLRSIERIQEFIRAGNVFELCLTQEFRGRTSAAGIDLHEALRRASPVPMGAYLRHGELEAICSSPERFLRGDAAGNLETRPIKGTRPRSADPADDVRLCEELRRSAKDHAENVMIVDLARNDLGRVCEFGSVAVQELCVVESYATVHHLVSTVRGRMRPGLRATDAIRAAFPGGSMTGAPKVEAMRLIAQIERSPRGVYSGAIGWLGGDGAFDLNITIRTLVKRGRDVSFHTGGAITADSGPEAEYAETLVKARALVEALASVERGHGPDGATPPGPVPAIHA